MKTLLRHHHTDLDSSSLYRERTLFKPSNSVKTSHPRILVAGPSSTTSCQTSISDFFNQSYLGIPTHKYETVLKSAFSLTNYKPRGECFSGWFGERIIAEVNGSFGDRCTTTIGCCVVLRTQTTACAVAKSW